MVGVITRKEGLGEPHRRPLEADVPILSPEGTPNPCLCFLDLGPFYPVRKTATLTGIISLPTRVEPARTPGKKSLSPPPR